MSRNCDDVPAIEAFEYRLVENGPRLPYIVSSMAPDSDESNTLWIRRY